MDVVICCGNIAAIFAVFSVCILKYPNNNSKSNSNSKKQKPLHSTIHTIAEGEGEEGDKVAKKGTKRMKTMQGETMEFVVSVREFIHYAEHVNRATGEKEQRAEFAYAAAVIETSPGYRRAYSMTYEQTEEAYLVGLRRCSCHSCLCCAITKAILELRRKGP